MASDENGSEFGYPRRRLFDEFHEILSADIKCFHIIPITDYNCLLNAVLTR
jgi:hypothetical protein